MEQLHKLHTVERLMKQMDAMEELWKSMQQSQFVSIPNWLFHFRIVTGIIANHEMQRGYMTIPFTIHYYTLFMSSMFML